jgi:hypothetical protein
MPTEPDNIAEAFRSTYRHLVDQAPTSEAEWPPVFTIQGTTPVGRARSGWIVAAGAFLITGSFWIGWLVAPGRSTPAADAFQVQTVTTAVAVPGTTGIPYTSPADAALAAALAQAPDLKDAQVTRIVGIYADDTTVDLRVQVQASDFCHWYGVAGHVQEGALEWRGGPALPCDE